MKAYQPSHIVPAGGWVMLLTAAVLGGAAIGWGVSLLSNLVYLILIFPLLMGVIGGTILSAAVRTGKVRSPAAAIGAAVLMTLVMYGSMWASDYVQFRTIALADLQTSTPGLDPAQADARIDSVLKYQTGQDGFVGYVLYEDQQGVSLGRVGSDQNQFNLGPVFSWAYWAVEVLIILWGVVRFGKKQADQPFCELCGQWYEKPLQLGSLGASRTKEVISLVENGQFVKLGEELQANPALPNVAVFTAGSAKDCVNGEMLLLVRSQVRDSRGNPTGKDLARGMISAAEAQELQRGVQNRRALYGY